MNYGKLSLVSETFTFHPPRRKGVIFHLVAIAALLTGSGVGLYTSAYLDLGSNFVYALFFILISIPLVPLLLYRLNDLQNSGYVLARDSIKIQWGLRSEIIPTNVILWVRPASDLLETLRMPWVRWPGAILGSRKLAGGTPVEFIASRKNNLILIGTYDRVYAVSPSDPQIFLQAYQRLTELGSLLSPQPESLRPTILLSQVWQTPSARYLILSGLFLSFALVIVSGLAAPNLTQVSLGFMPNGLPRTSIPGLRLMLLPILNAIFWTIDFFLGLSFFRRMEQRYLAYLLWSVGLLVAGFFWLSLFFILRIP